MRSNSSLNRAKLREKNIIITMLVIVLTGVAMVVTYMQINSYIELKCRERMQEAADTVMNDISNKLSRDSQVLNAMAEIIAAQDQMDVHSIQNTIRQFTPLTVAKRINVLLPGDVLVSQSGKEYDVSGRISFEQEKALGEHVTDRMTSIENDDILLIRHFVPVEKDGEVVAMVYATTNLKDLPQSLNIQNIYNGTAAVYLINRQNGDFLMDTYHETLGNLNDYRSSSVRDSKTMGDTVQEILDGKSGFTVISTAAPDTENLYFYYAPIGKDDWRQLGESEDLNQWAVAVTVPETEVMENAYRIRLVCELYLVAEVALLIAYFFWTLHNTNVTMKKAVLEERLARAENAERAKTMFLSNMSHDIRTPMNAIIGYATLAEAHIDDKERIRDYLSKILSSSNHLLSLINDILDMSRIESGRVFIEEKECHLPDMLTDLHNILVNQMHSKQLDFYIDTIDVVDEDIYCDKLHLNQVLLNLLSNAIKFTPAGGSVSFVIRQKPDAPEGYASYEFRVKDTGIGMSEEFLAHIFEPFEREANTTVSGIQGTGLGMAIAKNIVDMMGGTIEVYSQQGKGTEYVLSLMLRLQTGHRQIGTVKELQGLRALVVDDDYNVCDSVTKMLIQMGLRVDWTMSGKEAVLHARQAAELSDEFGAYIIDLYMPDLSGLELVKRIRRDVGENVPIIILTAYDWDNIEKEAKEAGVTAFCNKPVFVSTLRDTLLGAIRGNGEEPGERKVIDAIDSFQGRRILLVEDNELNREIALEILTASGLLVETAADGSEAVEKVRNSQEGYFDLILMDIQMPVMNGYEATRAIRNLEERGLSSVPIVAMTANAFEEDRNNAISCGMNDHITKPLEMEKLFGVLRKYLGHD